MERKLKGILKHAKSTQSVGMKAPIRVLNPSPLAVSSPSRIQFTNKVESHVYEGDDDTETEAMRAQIAENLKLLQAADAITDPAVVGLEHENPNVENHCVPEVHAADSTSELNCNRSPLHYAANPNGSAMPAMKQPSVAAVNPNKGLGNDKQPVGSDGQGPPSVEQVFGTNKPVAFPVVRQHKDGMGGTLGGDTDGSSKRSYKESMLFGSNSNNGRVSSVSDDRKVHFRFMQNDLNEEADVIIPKESVQLVHDRYQNVLYGYFLGNRLAYPVVEYFAKNAWSKYGFNRIMMNSKGFFFFKFDSAEGMENVIRDGPWLIRNNPIFLNIWSPSVVLKKEDMGKIAVWVKFHDVPLAAYTEDGLSLLASKIGTPKMLDRYTSDMCLDSWGRSSYARAIVEVSADLDLKESISVAIPHLDGEGFSRGMVRVEYEWRPPRCPKCCVFGHTLESCTMCVKSPESLPSFDQMDNNGFTEVTGKKTKKHRARVSKAKTKVEYRPVLKQKVVSNSYKNKSVRNSNSFNAFNFEGYDSNGNPIDAFQEEGIEEIRLEKEPGSHSFSGASTPVGFSSYG